MEYQASPFEPIRSFDFWGVALNQVLTNQASLSSFRDIAVPSRRAYLTPEEQVSLTEKIKDQYGGDNRILRAMLGIATNPWVWMGAVVSPPALESLRRSGAIFSSGRNVAKGIHGDANTFHAMGILTGHQALDGSLAGVALEVDDALRKRAASIDAKTIQDSLAKYYKDNPHSLKELGLAKAPRDLDEWLVVVGKRVGAERPEKLTKKIFHPDYTGPHEEFANTIKQFLAIELQKGYMGNKLQIPSLVPEASAFIKSQEQALKYGVRNWTKEGRYPITFDKWKGLEIENLIAVEKKLDEPHSIRLDGGKGKIVWETAEAAELMEKGVADQLRDIYHMEPLVNAYRATLDRRAVMLFGDETVWRSTGFRNKKGEREFIKFDDEKLETIIASLDPDSGVGAVFNRVGAGDLAKPGQLTAEGIDFLRSIIPIDDFNSATMNMKISDKKDLFKEMIRETVGTMFKNGNYLPRNVYKHVGKTSKSGIALGGRETTTMQSQSIRSSESLASLNRLAPRASASRLLHPESYEWLIDVNRKYGGSEETSKFLERGFRRSVNQTNKNTLKEISTYTYSLDGINAHSRYMKDTGEIYSRSLPHTIWNPKTKSMVPDTEVWGELVRADQKLRKGGLPAGGGIPPEEVFGMNTPWRSSNNPDIYNKGKYLNETFGTTLEDIVTGKAKNGPAGGTTIGDVLAHSHASMLDKHAQDLLRDVIIPHVSGRRPMQQTVMRALQIQTHRMVNSFAEGWMGKQIEKLGDPGKEFVSNLRNMATYENLSGSLAKGLYVGFLGANMMSVMLNLMQPLLHAAMWGGLNHVAPAYLDAFGEILNYSKDRWKLGTARISDAKRAELMTKNFKHVGKGLQGDLLGITPDVFANIDGASYAGVQSFGKEGMGRFLSMTLPMKLFEKAELMNRLVSAHTVDRLYRKAGIKMAKPREGFVPAAWNQEELNFYGWMTDTRRFVQEAQFGGSPLNMPSAFLGEGPAGGLLSNPLGRQFLSFLTRSFSSYAVTGKQISPDRYFKGGIPFIGGKRIPGGHYAADALRLMGTGAIAYEVGKEVLHSDLSRGLGINPVFELMSGGWVPPIVAIPTDMVKVAMGDLEIAKSSIPGMFPGGIAAVRAMGMLPQLGEMSFLPDLANNMQKSYVDWNTTTPDGHHPVFKSDGTLINYEKPFAIVMKGLGINLENHPKAGEVDGYLAKQRELIVKMESDYMNALIANNISKARKIETGFQKRFGVPLKISKSQWRSRMRNLETARMERIANTIPSEYKHLYQSTLAEEHKRLGLKSREEVLAGTTSGRRTKAGAERISTVKLDSTTVEEIKKHLKAQEKPIEEQGFDPFKAWNQ